MKYFIILCCLIVSIECPISCQVKDIVQAEGIKTPLRKNNIGKIYFTGKRIETSALQNTDFLRSYTLTNKSSLYFVAFFDNSLTNYLHRLAPGLSSDSLNKTGNYQFTLYLDGKPVYCSNLNPGAPSKGNQDVATLLNRPLIDNPDAAASWSEFLWTRFLHNGGDSSLTDGNHILRMEIRPYIKTDSVLTGELLASGDLSLNVIRHPLIDISAIHLSKINPFDAFGISDVHFDVQKILKLKGEINEGVFKKINSVIVIKNGSILIEEYFNETGRDTLHDTRSVGKSFTSTLLGLAIKDGYIKDEEQSLKDFYNVKSFQNYDIRKENIPLKELLTMSSGLDGNDDDGKSPGNEENMYPSPDWVKFALDLPFRNNPDGEWRYFTAGVIILGDILDKTIRGGIESYADKKLFSPLGITRYKWEYTPAGVPNTAGGIRLTSLDLARYGQLYLNGGFWKNRQIIPEEWVSKTLSKQKQIPDRINEFYGYLFWNKTFLINNKSYEAFYCAGNGGNYVMIFRDLQLVVVITATAYGQPYAHRQVNRMLSDYILPAVVE